MPTFKVTLHIQDGLTLGHVLMTKGVSLIHIVEESDKLLITHNIEKATKKVAPQNKFYHSSGKRVQDFIIEYMNGSDKISFKWAELGNHIEKLGFHKSSINNGITRLVKAKKTNRFDPGVYALVR
jgi:hypothetical protein